MKITLYIDTADSKITKVAIFKDNGKKIFEKKTDIQKSQNLLPLIEKALKSEKLNLKDLNEIEVNEGPGSFTGIRVGLTVANALAFVLKIPVNGKKISTPKYSESKFD